MAAPDTYEAAFLARLPRVLKGKWGQRFAAVVGGLQDVLIMGAKQATKQGLIDECADDAVPYHGSARDVEQGPGESTASWRERIATIWDWMPTATSKPGLADLLRFYAGVTELYVLDVVNDGADVLVDSNPEGWSRHWVTIGAPHPWTRPVVGPGLVVGPDLVVGITMTGTELSRIRRIYRRYKSGGFVGAELLVTFNAGSDPQSLTDLATDRGSGDLIAMPLEVSMVGFASHSMTVGKNLVVGQHFT